MVKEKEYKFSGNVERCVYNSEDFKVYALNVDKNEYPDIEHNKFGNVSISGELSDLTIGVRYDVIGTKSMSKYGVGYKVLNIKRDLPTTSEETYLFLREFLTHNQAKVLYDNYPDIVQRVKENRLDDIDLKKLKGIKEYTFNVIKNKIIDNFCLADLVIEFKGYLSLSVIKKIYKEYTSIDKVKKELNKDPYKCLCKLSGVGFKTADGILLELEKISKQNIQNGEQPIVNFNESLRESSKRCLACIVYLLEENENEGHTKMNLANLRSELIKMVPECANHFSEAMQSEDVYYNKETMSAAIKSTYNTELSIANTILFHINDTDNVWDSDVEKYRKVGDITLSDEQVQAISNVCKYNISILNGPAGVGKSQSVKAIINMLEDHKKSYKLFTPTGKSSKVLSDFTQRTASTIHRGLGYQPIDNWVYNKSNKLICDIVIIDEFSMVDVWLFKKVLDAIDLNQTKLLLIGDNAQLCSVGCGNLLHDFMESHTIPTTTLTKVFRYGEGGLMKIATDVRLCQTYLDSSMKNKCTIFGDNKDYSFIDLPSDLIPQNAVALYKKLLGKGYTIEDIQVLSAKNVGECGSVLLNNMIQKIANKNFGSETCMRYGETTYYIGDLVIQKVNNYKASVYNDNDFDDEETAFIANGETGIVKDISKSYILIDFDGVVVKYYKNDLQNVGLGYSISIHKSQGSASKIIILLTPQSHTFMLNSNLIYVGLTRMKEKCYHLGTLSSVNLAIKKKANLTRHTFMQEFLKNGISIIDTNEPKDSDNKNNYEYL